ncbi:hypothetical protein [Halospeciosus flavus]|uniref:Transposase n=1 Tax=Halospeciosus flavus TaxID=3032283 RepID=A0ABD5YYT9_9EURY
MVEEGVCLVVLERKPDEVVDRAVVDEDCFFNWLFGELRTAFTESIDQVLDVISRVESVLRNELPRHIRTYE